MVGESPTEGRRAQTTGGPFACNGRGKRKIATEPGRVGNGRWTMVSVIFFFGPGKIDFGVGRVLIVVTMAAPVPIIRIVKRLVLVRGGIRSSAATGVGRSFFAIIRAAEGAAAQWIGDNQSHENCKKFFHHRMASSVRARCRSCQATRKFLLAERSRKPGFGGIMGEKGG